MLTAHFWSPGLSGTKNQDSLFVLKLGSRWGELVFTAVCDGIGGLSQGELASGFVTEKLIGLIYDRLIDELGRGRWKLAANAVYRCLYESCRQLKAYGDEKAVSLGTTLVFACILGGKAMLFHSGDSRIYKLSGKRLKNLFPDDLKDGKLSAAIGSMEPKMPAMKMIRLFPGQGLLLASDGFYRAVPEKTVGEVISGERRGKVGLEKRLRALADEGMKKGGHDHISAVYVCRREERGETWKNTV